MSRGGARPGAGRPKGQGPHGEPTKPIRIPVSMVEEVLELIAQRKKRLDTHNSSSKSGPES